MSQSVPDPKVLYPETRDELDDNWFKEIMRDQLAGIASVEVGSVPDEDEGFLGILIPFTVKTKADSSGEKLRHFIVKIKADESEMYNDIKPLQFHPRESFFYKCLQPLFQSVGDAVLSAEDRGKFCFYPKSYLAEYDLESSRGLIVMDNLKEDGYDLVSFSQGLSLAELKSAVSVLAYHHALSHLVILEKNEEINSGKFKKFLNWVPETSLLSVWGTFLAEGLRWFANSHPEKIELESKLNQLSARSAEILGGYSDYRHGGLPVICHGDYWCNNIMYHQSGASDTNNIKLVDFQCVSHGTPGKDLATLVLSSTTPELRRICIDEVLAFYHKCFQSACTSLRLPTETLTMQNLKRDFKSSLLNGVLWCFISFEMFLTSEETEDRLYWILKDLADDGVY